MAYRKEHAITKNAYQSQPASGWYIDCRCGYRGGLRPTKEKARQDFNDHLARVAAGQPEPKKPWEK